MKNELVNPELVKFYVELRDLADRFDALTNDYQTYEEPLKKEVIESANAFSEVSYHLSELINADIMQRAKNVPSNHQNQ